MQLDVSAIRFLNKDAWRCLGALEMGMRTFEFVPEPLVAKFAELRFRGTHQLLGLLMFHGLAAYEKTQNYDGYRLTWKGYDYLAVNTLMRRRLIDAIGPRIGVGKEADVHIVSLEGQVFALKIHRLGRTSFRQVAKKRDYLRKGQRKGGWLQLSRLSATREFQNMKAFQAAGIPIPVPVDQNRHCVLMSYIDGCLLNSLRLGDCQLEDEKSFCPADLYDTLMQLVVRILKLGVVHGDFNEFNIMISRKSPMEVFVIDLPQIVSVEHPNAEEIFNRDVQSVKKFFEKRFNFIAEEYPSFAELKGSNPKTWLFSYLASLVRNQPVSSRNGSRNSSELGEVSLLSDRSSSDELDEPNDNELEPGPEEGSDEDVEVVEEQLKKMFSLADSSSPNNLPRKMRDLAE